MGAKKITVRDGVEVAHGVDGRTTLWLEPYSGGAFGRVGVSFSEKERHRLLTALTWKPGDAG